VTAKDYAALAATITSAAETVRPKPNNPSEREQAQLLVVFHLRTAASKLRELRILSRSRNGTEARNR
jgi:hypothetical protein